MYLTVPIPHGHVSHRRVSRRRVPYGYVPHEHVFQGHIIQGCAPHGHASRGRVSFTSLSCAQDTGGENPYIDTQDGFEASDCGRLGRQAAGHPWSALRVVKSCRKDCPTASVLPKPKQQLCIQSGTRAHYLNYLQEVGEAGKRSAGNRIGYQVIDRQVEDRQTGRNKADEH